jgi:hypothetical protein
MRKSRWTRWVRTLRAWIEAVAGEDYERLPSYAELKQRASRTTTGE